MTNGTTAEVYVPGDGLEPTHYAFGPVDDFITDWIVEKITPQGGNLVQVQAQKYDDKIFEGIDAPYACDSMSSTAANGGYNHLWELMPTPTEQAFPFATTRPNTWGEDGNASLWGWWVSGPAQQTDWGTDPSYFSVGSMDGWDWVDTARKLVYCGVEDVTGTQIVNVKGNGSVVHMSPPTSIYQGESVAGSSGSLVFTGYQGGSHAAGTIFRDPAGYYAIYVDGAYKLAIQNRLFVSLGVSTGSSQGNDYSVYISVGQAGGDYGQQVDVEIPFGPVHGRWVNLTCSESSTTEVIHLDPPAADRCIVRTTVNVTVTGQDGSTASGSATGAIETGSSAGFAELRPTWSSSAYNWPGMFSGTESLQLTLAHLSAFGDANVDHSFIRSGFLRNFS